MGPGSKINIEHALADSEQNRGYTEDWPIPLGSFYDITGFPIIVANHGAGTQTVDATDPGMAVVDTDTLVIQWGPLDTDPAIAMVPFLGQFVDKFGKLALGVHAILTGSGSNPDLDLLATFKIKPVGKARSAAITPSKVTVDGLAMATPANGGRLAEQATDVGSSLVVFEYDLADLTYSEKDSFSLRIGPDQAPGTNLNLQIYSVFVRQLRHASVPRADRFAIE